MDREVLRCQCLTKCAVESMDVVYDALDGGRVVRT